MTIQEAIKSGKPFRRVGWSHWQTNWGDKTVQLTLPLEDLMATDWETKAEARAFWVVDGIAFTSEAAAHVAATSFGRSLEIIKVVEVLD